MSKSLVRGSFSQRKSGGVDSRMTVEKKKAHLEVRVPWFAIFKNIFRYICTLKYKML